MFPKERRKTKGSKICPRMHEMGFAKISTPPFLKITLNLVGSFNKLFCNQISFKHFHFRFLWTKLIGWKKTSWINCEGRFWVFSVVVVHYLLIGNYWESRVILAAPLPRMWHYQSWVFVPQIQEEIRRIFIVWSGYHWGYMSAKAKDSGYIFISNPILISASFSFWPNFTLVLQQDFVAVDAVAAFPPPDVSVWQ